MCAWCLPIQLKPLCRYRYKPSQTRLFLIIFGPSRRSCNGASNNRWADILLIAPATANTLKLSHGLADDLLTTLCLATANTIYLAPAMNQQMWKACDAKTLTSSTNGVEFIGPVQGEQACGDFGLESGTGRHSRIFEQRHSQKRADNIKPLLVDKKIVITAGPTIEHIDPVRYLSNHSSGGWDLHRRRH